MKFFLDANIPYAILKAFKKINLIAIHARDVGLSRASDDEIMNYAIKSKSILMTKDLEFANPLVYQQKSRNGLIIFRLPFYAGKQKTACPRNFKVSGPRKSLIFLGFSLRMNVLRNS